MTPRTILPLKNTRKTSSGHPALKAKLSPRQRAADFIAHWGGSWTFIFSLFFIMFVWIIMNVVVLVNRYDPYPFILLNFVLSTLAAIQAPIILMSQNRQAERDRLNAHYDYQVNRKAEREIRDLRKDLKEIKALLRKERL